MATGSTRAKEIKPTVNFPIQQPGQLLPMIPSAIQPPAAGGPQPAQQPFQPQQPQASELLSGGVQQTTQAAQQKALAGGDQTTAGLVSRNTQNLLNDPSQGRVPGAQTDLALDELRLRQASDLEGLRQSTGGAANLGVNIQEMLGAQLGQRQEFSLERRKLEAAENDRVQQEGLAALSAGQQTVALEQQGQTSEINNLINSASSGLGFAEIAASSNELVSRQDFAGEQAKLKNEFDQLMQEGKFDEAEQMSIRMNDFAVAATANEQAWQTAERNAMNVFTEGLQMNEQDFTKALQYIDAELDEAAAANDFARELILEDKKADLRLHEMTQNFDHTSKLAILDSELTAAQAAEDVQAQRDILGFTYDLEANKILQEQGWEESQKYIDNELAQAIQNNDTLNIEILNQSKYDRETQDRLNDLNIERDKINLAQQGINMAKIEQQYNFLQNEIAAGRANTEDSVAYLTKAFGDSLPEGFEFTEPDPLAVQKALGEDYLNQQYQYALTQGQLADGSIPAGIFEGEKFVGLNEEFQAGFDSHMQDLIYGQDGTPLQTDIVALKAGDMPLDQITQDHIDYLLTDVSVPTGGMLPSGDFSAAKGEVGRGGSRRATYASLEGASFVNIDGEIWKINGMTIDNRVGPDWSNYQLTSTTDGASKTLTAK